MESSTLAKSDFSRLPGNFRSISPISSTSDVRVPSTPRLRSDELSSDSVEHRQKTAVRFDGDERGAANLVRTDHPAGKFGSERGLAFAALTTNHGVAFVA